MALDKNRLNKLIDIHRLSCPIFSDAKSQRACGNNAKSYIISSALLNFCGSGGTEAEFLSKEREVLKCWNFNLAVG